MKRTRTKRLAAAVVTAATLATALAGCGGDSSGDDAGASAGPLEVWTRSNAESAATYQLVFDAFTAKTGIEVDYKPVEEFDTQLQSRAAQKSLPDVLINDAGSMGGYVSQGFLLPIDQDAITGADQISDATWDQNVGRDGKTYGVPWSRQVFVTMVRKDWREKLGMPVPTNWQQLSELANAFATEDPDGDGQADTYGMVVPGSSKNGYAGWWASSYIWQAGGELLTSTGEGSYASAIDSPQTVTALQWVRQQFCTPGNVVPGSVNLTTADTPFFREGSAGIQLTGPYNIGTYAKAVGDANLEVIPMPAGPAGTTGLAEGENIYFGASSEKNDQQQALAEFLISPDAQKIGMTTKTLDDGVTTQPVVRLPVNDTVDVVAVTGDPRWQTVLDGYEEDSETYEWAINFQPFRQALGEGVNAVMASCDSDIPAQVASIDEAFTAELKNQDLLK